jgi:ZIP family zinc transporter
MIIEGWLEAILSVSGSNLYLAALINGGICAILTFLGATPALLGARLTEKFIDVGLGFSAGVMLVASFTSLLLPGIELGGYLPVASGFLLGVGSVHLLNLVLPHEHLVKGFEGPPEARSRLKAIWLLVFAIIIHNFPEGLAVGSSTAFDPRVGLLTAIAIGIQDIPEGFAVAAPLVGAGVDLWKALVIAGLSGLVEMLMAPIPVAIYTVVAGLLPLMLGFAGGAMIYVVSHEIIPETHRHGHENLATLGLIIGFLLMLALDTLL